MKTISKEILKHHGFNEWQNDKFQKAIKDENGIRYFININRHEFNIDTPNPITFWGVTVQMNTKFGTVSFELVQWFNNDGEYSGKTIEDMYAYFDWVWKQHDKPYYETF